MFRPTDMPVSTDPMFSRSAWRTRLDVLLPTLDRAHLLERTLQSLLAAPVPRRFEVLITVIENGCTDGTVELVEWMSKHYPGRIRLIHEPRRGKSRALNAGLAATDGELVGMVDDDEVVDPEWFAEIDRAFQDPTLDFAGGPYRPELLTPIPSWVPPDYLGVLGVADNGPVEVEYSSDFPGILKGGNAVIRRRVLDAVGPYAEHLGPSTCSRLLSCEDEDMYHRLLKHGARGRYLPGLVIHHHIPAERLTPPYYRRWCFWRGVSRGLMDRAHPLPVRYLAGVPRYLFGRAARGLLRLVPSRLRLEPWHRSFADELPLWDLAGYIWGRHLFSLFRFWPLRSRRIQPSRSAAERHTTVST